MSQETSLVGQFLIESCLVVGLAVLWVWVFAFPRLASAV